MEHWTEELFRLMVRKHNERTNPKSKVQTPEQMKSALLMWVAATGGMINQ
jgi:hypothetical protein